MIRPDERQLRELLAELDSIRADIELGILDRSKPDGKRWSLTAFDLMARARMRNRDGFPPSNGDGSGRATKKGGDYGGGTVPSLALAGDTDVDRQHWDRLLVRLQLMLVNGRHAVRELAEATPAQRHPDRPEFGCRICSRPGKPEPIYRAERCRWCYDFWLMWKVDVPDAILKLRREGRRITEQAIRAELDEEMVG